jgi:hypothetical protein
VSSRRCQATLVTGRAHEVQDDRDRDRNCDRQLVAPTAFAGELATPGQPSRDQHLDGLAERSVVPTPLWRMVVAGAVKGPLPIVPLPFREKELRLNCP